MRAELNNLNRNLSSFKKKYYLNLFIRGSIFLLSLVLAYFLLASVVEYNLWLSQGTRFFVFASFFIVYFNQDYAPQAPFQFEVKNENLNAYFNEDFTLQLNLTGNSFPEAVFIVSGTKRLKMESSSSTAYTYTFEKLQSESTVQFEA